MAHVRAHSKMEEKTVLFIEQMVGRATITFGSRSIKTNMPAFQSRTAEGVTSELAAVVETHPYKVLGSSQNQVSLMSTEPGSGRKRHIILYTFEEPDRMWVYWGGGAYFDPHVREYFVREK